MTAPRITLMAALICAGSGAAVAHHSYAMFDGTRVLTVSGSVAKIEWTNPHVFVWLYVPSTASASGFDLYAFENGSTNVLSRRGWSKSAVPVGEKVTLEYWPLRDGRNGGHLKAMKRADGSVLQAAGGPRGVDGTDTPARFQETRP